MSRPVAQRIATKPDPFEAFHIAQGFRVGNVLYLSGHAALDEHGALVGAGDFDAQAEAAFQALERSLRAGGSSLDEVFKVTIYMTDMSHFPKIIELRQRWFSPPYPADTIVEVKSLALPELMFEIEAIALVGGELRDC